MDELIEAIKEQTKAINALAESNMALVDILMQDMDIDQPGSIDEQTF